MPGRRIRHESEFAGTTLDAPVLAWRRAVLRETVQAFEERGAALRARAAENLAAWAAAATAQPRGVAVVAGDWGEVAGRLTRAWGACFAVLNMANAYVPGGAYVEGLPAQEENLFRRTDCHFSVDEAQLAQGERYRPEVTALLEGRDGRVYLDRARPRTCVRGPELPGGREGYAWLADDAVFPFYELRAAARDCRRQAFDEPDARARIRAQLDTLVAAGQRHAVLGASGCGAFANPPARIAALYRQELDARVGAFDCVAFAIYHAGYGPDNHAVFRDAFAGC